MGSVLAALFASPILHETVNMHIVIASLFILFGVFVFYNISAFEKEAISTIIEICSGRR